MKNIIKYYLFLYCVAVPTPWIECYKDFLILIASYNNEQWAERNIISAFQNYPEDHYRIIFIDDYSSDATLNIVKKSIKTHKKEHLVTVIHNETRKGALKNHWASINTLAKDDEIIVILDGDDALAHNEVLNYLNKKYSNNDIWLTYGQYQDLFSKTKGFNRPMPEDVVKNNEFRKWTFIPSHLRTFYAKLYKHIKIEDLTINGEFFEMCADMATMIPMIEMARDHFMFIPKVLYLYNERNPISDHHKSAKLQKDLDIHVRSLSVYQPLEKLF